MTTYREGFREVQREAYWSLPRVAVGMLIAMVVLYGLGFLATGGDLAIYKFWAPKQENAKRQVFENTQGYVQGKTEYINNLRLDYELATGPQKEVLRRTILTEASTVDNSKLPEDLQLFISSLKGGPQ
jgi:hypothetical protein